MEPVTHEYRTRLRWTSEKKGVLGCDGKPDMEVACPPEFGGHPGLWSPEDMFVGSIELCTMSTFLYLAEKKRLRLKSYKSEAYGKARFSEGRLRYVEIAVRPAVAVFGKADMEKAKAVFGQIEKWCLINNSIALEVSIVPEISCDGEGA